MRFYCLWMPMILTGCTTADSAYRKAERSYLNGDWESARRECVHAVDLDPGHSAAWAILLELDYLSEHPSDPVIHHRVRADQATVELQDSYARAVRAYNLSDYSAAARELEWLDALISWMEVTPDLEQLHDDAQRLSTKLRDPKGQPRK